MGWQPQCGIIQGKCCLLATFAIRHAAHLVTHVISPGSTLRRSRPGGCPSPDADAAIAAISSAENRRPQPGKTAHMAANVNPLLLLPPPAASSVRLPTSPPANLLFSSLAISNQIWEQNRAGSLSSSPSPSPAHHLLSLSLPRASSTEDSYQPTQISSQASRRARLNY